MFVKHNERICDLCGEKHDPSDVLVWQWCGPFPSNIGRHVRHACLHCQDSKCWIDMKKSTRSKGSCE